MGARPRKKHPRSNRITMALSDLEREALEGIAAIRNEKHFTPLLRTASLHDLVQQWLRIKGVIEGKVQAAVNDGEAAEAPESVAA